MGATREWFHTFEDSLWTSAQERVEDARFVKRALRLRRGQTVLDVPCGKGALAMPLARLGCRVTGVDLRPSFVAAARRQFRREGLAGRFLAMDMRDLDFEGEFAAVFNWFGSFGYFTDAENLDVLRRFARGLRPGGRVLIDQVNRERILRHFIPERRFEPTGTEGRASLVHIRNRWDGETERVESVWTALKHGKRTRSPLSMRLYTPAQLERLFERVGLSVERAYGNWQGAPWSRSAKRLALVGRKKP
ncbi:MAG TPA: class I SAM-dependent methyltransferase [Sumerlaeia bacterium]|nr:class I SAM-dependent methyltransferase [Sumerlaeia bacterium]